MAFSWSDYFTSFLSKLNVHLPDWLTCSHLEASQYAGKIADFERDNPGKPLTESLIELRSAWQSAPVVGGLRVILDAPALIINLLITYLVYRGVKESRNFSNVMVVLKLAVVILVILVGGALVFSNGLTGNWTPVNGAGIRSFMPEGFGGVMAAVSGVFFCLHRL